MTANTKYQASQLVRQDAIRWTPPTGYREAVPYDIQIPLEYWKTGNRAIPQDTLPRVNQLEEYLALYNAEYDQYFYNPLVVVVPYHFMIAERLINFLMQYPPEFNFDWDGIVSDRFMQQLNKELPNVLIDLVRFGTGLFNVVNTEFGAEVQAPLPIHWFPIDDSSDVLLIVPNNENDPYTLHIHYQNGQYEMREYEQNAGMLGKRLRGGLSEQFGNEQAWSELREVSLGRVSPIIPVALEPTDGDWGRSQYFDMTSLSLELIRRLTANSEILNEHGNPRIKVIPNDGVDPNSYRTDDDDDLLEVYTEQTRLDSLRQSNVVIIPHGYADMDYLFWDGTLDDHFMQFDKTQEQMFAITHLPLTIMGLDGSVTIPASGRALRFQFIDPHTHIQKVQTQAINALKQVILTGAIYNANLDIRSISDRIDITWRNVFDEIDESGVVEMSEGDDAEIVDDGEMEQPFQAEEQV